MEVEIVVFNCFVLFSSLFVWSLRNSVYICSEDSVANDYRFVDCGSWPLVSRSFFLFAHDVFNFLVNGLFYFLVELAAFSNELPLRYVYG